MGAEEELATTLRILGWSRYVRAMHNPKLDKDYMTECVLARKDCSGASGKIRKLSNAHGLCFEVEFPSGKRAWYESEELTQIN